MTTRGHPEGVKVWEGAKRGKITFPETVSRFQPNLVGFISRRLEPEVVHMWPQRFLSGGGPRGKNEAKFEYMYLLVQIQEQESKLM